jgi:hypothetical protein
VEVKTCQIWKLNNAKSGSKNTPTLEVDFFFVSLQHIFIFNKEFTTSIPTY